MLTYLVLQEPCSKTRNIKGYKMQAMPRILYKHFSARLVSLLLHGSFLAFDWFQIIRLNPLIFNSQEKKPETLVLKPHVCALCVE